MFNSAALQIDGLQFVFDIENRTNLNTFKETLHIHFDSRCVLLRPKFFMLHSALNVLQGIMVSTPKELLNSFMYHS